MAGPRPGAGAARATAFVAGLRLLGRRDYASAEIRTRLTARGYPSAEIEAAVARLQSDGSLDDRRAAAAHARQSALKGRGRKRIAIELARRGVDADVIDDVLASTSEDDEVRSIRRVLARRRGPTNLTADARRALIRHLLRRGFAMDAIRRALGRGDDE